MEPTHTTIDGYEVVFDYNSDGQVITITFPYYSPTPAGPEVITIGTVGVAVSIAEQIAALAIGGFPPAGG